MYTLLYLAGLVFFVSGLLSFANITNVALEYVSLTKIHLLPFLAGYPAEWVYIVLGLLLIVLAGGVFRKR